MKLPTLVSGMPAPEPRGAPGGSGDGGCGEDLEWERPPLASAGNVVFQGAADGWFSAYAAGSGEPLWPSRAPVEFLARRQSQVEAIRQYIRSRARAANR